MFKQVPLLEQKKISKVKTVNVQITEQDAHVLAFSHKIWVLTNGF